MTDLEEFAGDLEAIVGRPTSHRPFVVEGSPLTCRAFVVGINPATRLRAGFWDFWEPGYGFRRREWLEKYRAERVKARKGPFSATRERIQRLVCAAEPVRVLETNLYSVEQPEPGRGAGWTTKVFDFLLERIQPEMVLVHGKPARKHVERKFGCTLTLDSPRAVKWEGVSLRVRATDHFTRVTYKQAWELGAWLASGA